jgi:hypothetical protein
MSISVFRVASLLIVLVGVAQEPANARCRRAILEAARAAEVQERELGAEAAPDSPAAPRTGGVRVAALAPPTPERPASASRPGTSTHNEAVAQAPPPSVPPPALPRFTIAPGETLRTVLTRWADASGWQLVWDASHDFSLSAPASFPGDFREAATRLLESLQSNGAPFGAELYSANRVIRVTRVR